MTEQPFDENDLRSLGEKLAGLELNDRERAAMAALLTDGDVSGFARFDVVGGIRKGYIVTQDLQDWFTRQGPLGLHTDGSGDPKAFRPDRF